MFTRNFKGDYEAIEHALEQGKHFALSRFGDGEWALLRQKPYKSASGWTTKGQSWISGPLLSSLRADLDGYCVGYSPPCCHPKCVEFFAENVQVPKIRRTFSTVLFHGNFVRARTFFSRTPAVLVGCTRGCQIRVPARAVDEPVDIEPIIEKMMAVRDKPIFVAAGPLACVLVHQYWSRTRSRPEDRVACIDIGGVLDQSLHGKQTRYYQDASSGLHKHFCKWDDWTSARQREVIPVHNATKGRFDRFRRAPNAMKSPMEQVADRRATGSTPKWLSKRPKETKKR